jgi:hypothetical protein
MITNAITIDSITDRGTATFTGKIKRNKGTAISDSPKPKVDRTSEAIKLMKRINKITNKEYLLIFF